MCQYISMNFYRMNFQFRIEIYVQRILWKHIKIEIAKERKKRIKENNQNNRLHKRTIDLFDAVHSPCDTHNHIFMLIDFVIAEGDTHTHMHAVALKFLLIFGVIFTFFEIVNFNNAALHCSSSMHRVRTEIAYNFSIPLCVSLSFQYISLKYLFNAFIGSQTHVTDSIRPALFARNLGCGVRS